MEKVEHAAWTVWLARQLGQAQTLPAEEVTKLTQLGISKGYRPPLAAAPGQRIKFSWSKERFPFGW